MELEEILLIFRLTYLKFSLTRKTKGETKMARDNGDEEAGKSIHNSLAPMGLSEKSNNPSKGNVTGPLQSVGEQNKMAAKASGIGKDKRMS